MSRWAYVANITLPSVRANAVQVLNQCQALIRAGEEVELLVPRRRQVHPGAGTLAGMPERLGLSDPPPIRMLPCLDLIAWGERRGGRWAMAAFHLQNLTFLLSALAVVLRGGFDKVYTREIMLPLIGGRLMKLKGITSGMEIHDFPRRKAGLAVHRRAARRTDAVVTISHGLARAFREAGLEPARLRVAPDGVADDFFRDRGQARELRQKLDLPRELIGDGLPVAMYAGGLYWAWKGVGTLLEAHTRLDHRAWLVIVGGSPRPEHLENLRHRARQLGLERVAFTGFVAPARVADHLAAADVLVLPNSAKAEISRSYTSPLKLFEYLAAARPVVASALPSLEEILEHGVNGWLVRPDDPEDLARGLARVMGDPDLAARLARAGRKIAGSYTWSQRAQTLMEALDR